MLDRSNAKYLLPNGVTLGSMLFGFYAILVAASAQSPEDFGRAAIAVFIGGLLDNLDGRVARMTKTQSEFGVQLDTLADMVTAGLAPAFVIYQWALFELGWVGVLGSFAFVAGAALRLARFNVMAAQHVPGSKRFFLGLSSPMAAATMMALVWVHSTRADEMVIHPLPVLMLALGVAYLMVSSIRFYTFKEKTRLTRNLMMVAAATLLTLGFTVGWPMAFLISIALYVGTSVVVEVVLLRPSDVRRQREARDAAALVAIGEDADESSEIPALRV